MRRNATNHTNKNTTAKIHADFGCRNFSNTSFHINSLEYSSNTVTEDVSVIAVADYGCVGESVLGHSVVVADCSAAVGDVISATFYVPAMDQNGYYDRIEAKLTMVNP